jgi:hypothetical protein
MAKPPGLTIEKYDRYEYSYGSKKTKVQSPREKLYLAIAKRLSKELESFFKDGITATLLCADRQNYYSKPIVLDGKLVYLLLVVYIGESGEEFKESIDFIVDLVEKLEDLTIKTVLFELNGSLTLGLALTQKTANYLAGDYDKE